MPLQTRWKRREALALAAGALLPSLAQAADALRRIAERGQINVGYHETVPPFAALGPSGQPIGLAIDVCNALLKPIALAAGVPDVRVRFIPIAADRQLQAIRTGQVDLQCGGVADTPEHQRSMAFSPPLFISSFKFLMHKRSGITTLTGLRGKTIAVVGGSYPEDLARRYSVDNALDLVIQRVTSPDAAMAQLRLGHADAFLRNDVLHRGALAALGDAEDFLLLPTPVGAGPLAIALQPDARLQRVVAGVFAGLVTSGQFEVLYDKWLVLPNPLVKAGLGLPITTELRAAHERLR